GTRHPKESRRERRQSVISTFCPAEGDKKIFSFDKSSFPQAFAKCFDHAVGFVGRAAAEKSDDWHRRLLRARCERPRHRRAAEQRDERAPFHSITSSARASTVEGMSSPSALAVLRLIVSSYLVGVWTGKSAAFSPLRMRSA